MAIPLFKHILGSEKRTHRRWVSGHLDKGEKRKREIAISEHIAAFKEEMGRKGIAFRGDRDAWEAYWTKYPRAHMDLVGASVDEVLGEKAFQVFKSFWERASKPKVVRFAGDGIVATAPTLLTLGKGASRVRADPIEFLKSKDPDLRGRGVEWITDAIERYDNRIESDTHVRTYLVKVRDGLETDQVAIEDPKTRETIVQGLLSAPEFEDVEETDDDAE